MVWLRHCSCEQHHVRRQGDDLYCLGVPGKAYDVSTNSVSIATAAHGVRTILGHHVDAHAPEHGEPAVLDFGWDETGFGLPKISWLITARNFGDPHRHMQSRPASDETFHRKQRRDKGGYHLSDIFCVPVVPLGWTPSRVSPTGMTAGSKPVHWSTTVIGDWGVVRPAAQAGMAAFKATTLAPHVAQAQVGQAAVFTGFMGMS